MADEPNPEESEGMKKLRQRAEAAEKAEARAALAEKKIAFLEAGVPVGTKPAQALLNSYEGELTPEAIQAEAKEWGLTGTTTSEPAPEPEPEAKEIITDPQSIRDGLEGSPATSRPPDKTAHEQAFDGFLKDREDGRSMTDATNRAFGSLIKSAAAGDRTALFDRHKWEEEARAAGHGAENAY